MDTQNSFNSLRCFTIGIDTTKCISKSIKEFKKNIYKSYYDKLIDFKRRSTIILENNGFKVLSYRISTPPISEFCTSWSLKDIIEYGQVLDELCIETGYDFIGGFSAFLEKTNNIQNDVLKAFPETFISTKHLCGFINASSTIAGMNVGVVKETVNILKKISFDKSNGTENCARFSVTTNAANVITPYMPNSYFNDTENDLCLFIGTGGIEVINNKLKKADIRITINEIAQIFRDEMYHIAKKAEIIGLKIAKELSINFGGIDISLSPLPYEDKYSLVSLFESIGLESIYCPGSIAVLSLINDAIKKGGYAGSTYLRGLQGTFLSVSEDIRQESITKYGESMLNRLLALSSICSIGIDMVSIPYDTDNNLISGLICDELAMGNIHRKMTAVRLILAHNDSVEFKSHSFLGKTNTIKVTSHDNGNLMAKLGFIPPSI